MSASIGTNPPLLDCHCYLVDPASGTFLNYVTKHKAALIDSVHLLPKEEAAAEIELALTFMQHYMQLEDDGLIDKPESKQRVLIDRRKSLFEILLDLHTSMRATCVGFQLYFYGENPITGEFIKHLLRFPSFSTRDGDQLALTSDIALHLGYCTMIVFDSSDLQSASDRLAAAWSTNDAPWAIRSVLVQENVKDAFTQLVKSKLKPFSDSQTQLFKDPLMKALDAAKALGSQLVQNDSDPSPVKPTLAIVPGVQYLLPANTPAVRPSPIVVLGAFRTAKEAVSLANSNNGGSVSLWTEDLSLTFEVAYGLLSQTVWVNSYAEFNPDCPYTFRKEDFCYGSNYAVCEKKVKRVFAPSAAQPSNSTERNRAAIKSLGTFVAETRSYRGNTVQIKGGVHYEINSSQADLDAYGENRRLAIAENFWDSYISLDVLDRRFLLETVHNQRKVICIPFGVTFAN